MPSPGHSGVDLPLTPRGDSPITVRLRASGAALARGRLIISTSAQMLVTVSKASVLASSSVILMSYLSSRYIFSETIENESTMPLEISGVSP